MYGHPALTWDMARQFAPSSRDFHAYLRKTQLDLFPDEWDEAERVRLEKAALALAGADIGDGGLTASNTSPFSLILRLPTGTEG